VIVFEGPLLLQHNSKSIEDCEVNQNHMDWQNPPWSWPNKTLLSFEGSAFGIQAANTTLIVNGPTTLLGNTQGAIAVTAGSAVFKGAVTATNNQGKAGVLVFKNSTAEFKDSLLCIHHADASNMTHEQPEDDSSSCIQVQNSAAVFRGSVTVKGSVQVACSEENRGPCIHWGGAAMSCDNSSVRFLSSATFSHNIKRFIKDYAGLNTQPVWSAWNIGGGAWNLRACKVVASHRVRFLNNSAIGGGGAIHATQRSSLVFAGGLEVSGNSAALGGGVFLAGSKMQLSGGRMLCKGNVAGEQGACIFASAAEYLSEDYSGRMLLPPKTPAVFWQEYSIVTPYESLVVWNSSASCVQGNSIVNGTMHDPAVCTMKYRASYDPAPVLVNMTDICLAAVALAGSRVRCLGSGHNFGNDHAEGNYSCAITVFPVYMSSIEGFGDGHSDYQNKNFTGSFECIGRVSHHHNASLHAPYNANVEGDVCAASCKGDTCLCRPGSEWSEAACKCV
jgi:predicted outer membrane repeat protein